MTVAFPKGGGREGKRGGFCQGDGNRHTGLPHCSTGICWMEMHGLTINVVKTFPGVRISSGGKTRVCISQQLVQIPHRADPKENTKAQLPSPAPRGNSTLEG